MKTLLLITTLFTLLSTNVFSYGIQRATSNLAHDYASCSGFYLISAKGITTLNDDELTLKLLELSKQSFYISAELSNIDVTVARTEMAIKEQMEEMKNDYSNFSIILNKHSNLCKELLDGKGVERMEYWLDKKELK